MNTKVKEMTGLAKDGTLMGAILGTRNPSAHERFGPLDAQEALEYLGLASLLMRRLDDADVVNRAAGISDPTPRL